MLGGHDAPELPTHHRHEDNKAECQLDEGTRT
jgi:hypothetical protein